MPNRSLQGGAAVAVGGGDPGRDSGADPRWTVSPYDCSLTYEYRGGLARAPACDRTLRAPRAALMAGP